MVDCVVNSCPNLKQLKLTVIRNCDEDVLDLINRKGRLLEYLDIMIEMGDPLSLDIFAALVDNCPNLKTLKLNGMLTEYHDDLMKFHHRFRQMGRLSEQHLKLLKYLDIRISCKWYPCPIMEVVKKLCLRRCGQLAEIKIFNPERFISDTEFINGLHVLPAAQKRLAKEAALFRLHCQRFFDGTIAKQSSLHLDGNPMLLRYSREINNLDLDSVRYFRHDFSAQ
ncbi:hypothetical protein HDE_00517 [Halotydeus destructor]|nr:hypothetical protein HDE_00517 [Halotydeus destructor]